MFIGDSMQLFCSLFFSSFEKVLNFSIILPFTFSFLFFPRLWSVPNDVCLCAGVFCRRLNKKTSLFKFIHLRFVTSDLVLHTVCVCVCARVCVCVIIGWRRAGEWTFTTLVGWPVAYLPTHTQWRHRLHMLFKQTNVHTAALLGATFFALLAIHTLSPGIGGSDSLPLHSHQSRKLISCPKKHSPTHGRRRCAHTWIINFD